MFMIKIIMYFHTFAFFVCKFVHSPPFCTLWVQLERLQNSMHNVLHNQHVQNFTATMFVSKYKPRLCFTPRPDLDFILQTSSLYTYNGSQALARIEQVLKVSDSCVNSTRHTKDCSTCVIMWTHQLVKPTCDAYLWYMCTVGEEEMSNKYECTDEYPRVSQATM